MNINIEDGIVKKTKTYSTVYHTKYRGSKWWNCFVTLNEESHSGYGGNKDNFLIIERYTTREHTGYIGGYDYDYEWRTSEPWRWAWEDHWTSFNSRKSFRYQSRTLYWNENANPGWEKVPLNYGLYDDNGERIESGLVWTYNKKNIRFDSFCNRRTKELYLGFQIRQTQRLFNVILLIQK